MNYILQISRARGKQFKLKLVGDNGETIMTGETLKNHSDAEELARNILHGNLEIKDLTGIKAKK